VTSVLLEGAVFASPFEAGDLLDDVTDYLCAHYALAVAGRVRRASAARSVPFNDGLADALEALRHTAAGAASLRTADLRSALSCLRDTDEGEDSAPARAQGQLLIAFWLADRLDRFEVELPGGYELQAMGHPVPSRGPLTIEADSRELRIRCARGLDPRALFWVRRASGELSLPSDGWGWLYEPGSTLVLTRDVHPGTGAAWSDSGAETWGSAPDAVARLRDAMDLVEASAPAYTAWIRRVVRTIVPVRSTVEGSLLSGSDRGRPGEVYLNLNASAAGIAESLVHEASHQYFHLLEGVGPLAVADAPQAFSVLKNAYRPLDLVLLGYHAVVNMILFYRGLPELVAAGATRADLLRIEEEARASPCGRR
jgi:HEXXH motif-containing protein